jgi:hypothetical protein
MGMLLYVVGSMLAVAVAADLPTTFLRQSAESSGMLVGSAASPSYFDPTFNKVLSGQYNIMTPENVSWCVLASVPSQPQPTPSSYLFVFHISLLLISLLHTTNPHPHVRTVHEMGPHRGTLGMHTPL